MRSSLLRRRDAGGTLPELRIELCRDTSALERESASTRRSVFGLGLGFARVGVNDPGVDTADKPTEVTDDERECADVMGGKCEGRDGVSTKAARFLVDPLRAPRPLTAAPSLIHPWSFSSSWAMRFLSFFGVGDDGSGGGGGRGASCERRPKNRRVGDSVRAPSSLSVSTSRRTDRRFVAVRVFHFSEPPE